MMTSTSHSRSQHCHADREGYQRKAAGHAGHTGQVQHRRSGAGTTQRGDAFQERKDQLCRHGRPGGNRDPLGLLALLGG
jgi:hypothetical protein